MSAIPQDPLIPALGAFAREGLVALLIEAGVSRDVDDVRLLRHCPGSRLTFRVGTGREPLVVKAYRKFPGTILQVMAALEGQGLASGRGPTAAGLAGINAGLGFTVTRWLDGPSGWDLLRGGNGDRVAELAAQWIVAAEEAGISQGAPYGPAEVVGWAVRWRKKLAHHGPGIGARASGCLDLLERRMPASGTPGLRHGAFGLKHIFDLGSGPGVIDWDSPKNGALEVDVATFLARLSHFVNKNPGLNGQAALTSKLFRQAVAPLVNDEDLLWYQAASLLKAATYASYRSDGDAGEHVKVLLDEALDALRSRG